VKVLKIGGGNVKKSFYTKKEVQFIYKQHFFAIIFLEVTAKFQTYFAAK